MTEMNSKDAERAVLGCLIQRPQDAAKVRARIGGEDFTGFERRAWAVLEAMLESGAHIDPLTYRQAIQDDRGLPADETVAYVFGKLIETPWSLSAVEHYAQNVREASRRRRLLETGMRLVQRAENPVDDTDDIAVTGIAELDRLVMADLREDIVPVLMEDFLQAVDPAPDWLIEGIISRADRTLITAGEGVGKSMLTRMLVVAAAVGIHPFWLEPIKPARVLLIDCENNASQTRGRIGPIVEAATHEGRYRLEGRLGVHIKPEGLDLTKAVDAGWLMRTAEHFRPDIIAVGPLYRLHMGNPNDEGPARLVAGALDAVRVRLNCSIITECHAGHGAPGSGERELRPYGSSLWRRWPETIRALRPTLDAAGGVDRTRVTVEYAGRFDREPRQWPDQLEWGGKRSFPWTVPLGMLGEAVA